MAATPQGLAESLIDVLLHELRQPLLCALVLAERIETAIENLDSAKVERSAILKRDSIALVSSIYQMRELISTGSMLTERRYTTYGWQDKILKIFDGFQAIASSKGVQLDVQSQLQGVESGPDVRLIQQICSNLITNAFDALDEVTGLKTVKMSLWVDNSTLYLTVEDSGKGVSDDQKDKLFNRGFTTKSARGGSGIGLWLCKKLSEVMGGHLSLGRSSLLGGAEFTMQMPLNEELAQKSAE